MLGSPSTLELEPYPCRTEPLEELI